MEKILNDQGVSKLYIAPDNQAITSIIVEMQRGAVNQTPGALQAWNKPVIVSAVENLSGELAVIGESYTCYHEKTHVYLPPNTRAINLNIPRGNVCDVFAEFGASSELDVTHYTRSTIEPLPLANGHTWEQYDAASGLTINFWQWNGDEWIAKTMIDISSFSEKLAQSDTDKFLIEDASGNTRYILASNLSASYTPTPPTEKAFIATTDKILLDDNLYTTVEKVLSLVPPSSTSKIDPATVSNRIRHHRANNISGNNDDTVSSWNDDSSSAIPAVSAGAPKLKTNKLNGKSSVYFNGSSGFKLPNVSLGEFTIFGCINLQSYALLMEHSTNVNSAANGFYIGNHGDSLAIKRGGSYLAKNILTDWLINAPHIFSFKYRGRSFNSSFRLNGIELFPQTDGANPGIATYTDDLYLMCRANNSVFAIGDIFEIIIFNRALKPYEISGIEAYLSDYYGI